MSEWWPILFFMAFLFASTVPILVTVLIQHRSDPSGTQGLEADPLAGQLPARRFFTDPAGRNGTPAAGNSADAIVASIQAHLEREQELAAGFVTEPSFSSLHRQSRRAVRPVQLERYLDRELKLAGAFVAAPSVESLHRRQLAFN